MPMMMPHIPPLNKNILLMDFSEQNKDIFKDGARQVDTTKSANIKTSTLYFDQ